MPNYDYKFISLHNIDLNARTNISKPIPTNEDDIKNYIIELIEKEIANDNNRKFNIRNLRTSVISNVTKLINLSEVPSNQLNSQIKQEFQSCIESIANKLLEVELETSDKYEHFTSVQKGTLIQSIIEEDSTSLYYVIAKIEHFAFIDEKDFKKHIGLPYEKKILKSCIIEYSASKVIQKIYISDTNTRLSNYWWDKFLELNKEISDKDNTQIALSSICHSLAKKLKTDHPKDFAQLKNNIWGYFRTQSAFNFDNMLNNVFGSYHPYDTDVDMAELKRYISELPDKKNFDKRFDIIQDEVMKKINNVIQINDKIDLNLKDHIANLSDIIKSVDESGEKYIKIKIDNEHIFKMFS